MLTKLIRKVAIMALGQTAESVTVENVYEEDPLVTVIISAKTTVDEMLAAAGPGASALHDDHMDLRLILMAGVPDGR